MEKVAKLRTISCFINPGSCGRVIYGVICNPNTLWEDTPTKST